MKDFEVAIVKFLCPVCGKECEENIMINSVLTPKHAEQVKEMHNKVVGWASHACDECIKHKDDCVYFIGIDSEKSESNEPYRTGNVVGVKKDAPIVNECKEFILKLDDGTEVENPVASGDRIGLQYIYIDSQGVENKLEIQLINIYIY